MELLMNPELRASIKGDKLENVLKKAFPEQSSKLDAIAQLLENDDEKPQHRENVIFGRRS